MTDEFAITYQGTEYTMRDLTDAPMVDLIKLHNDLAQELGRNVVSRFESRGIGMKRTWDLLRSLPVNPLDDPFATIGARSEPHQSLVDDIAGIDYHAQADDVAEAEAAPVQEPTPVEEAPAPAQERKTDRKKREMYFHLPVKSEIKPPRKGTLRDVVLQDLLAQGLTFPQVVEKVKAFDAARAAKGVDMKGSDQHPERRAYEIVRIIHYWLGYGLRQSPEGVITAITNKD